MSASLSTSFSVSICHPSNVFYPCFLAPSLTPPNTVRLSLIVLRRTVGDKWLAHFWIQSKVLKGKQKDLIFLMQMCRLNPSCHVCSCFYAPLSKALFCTWEGLTTCLKKKLQNYRNRNPGGFLSPVILSEGFQLGSKQWPMWCWDLLPFVIDLV